MLIYQNIMIHKILKRLCSHRTVFDSIIEKQAPADIIYEDERIMCFKSI